MKPIPWRASVAMNSSLFCRACRRFKSPNVLPANLIQQIAAPLRAGVVDIQVSASIGIALYPDQGDSSEVLIRAADQAMYKVKHEGKNNFGFARSQA